MNTTLPAPRDLPPHRQELIRAELERAVTGHRSRRGHLTPVVTAAVAAVAVVAVIVVVAPWRQDGDLAPPATETPGMVIGANQLPEPVFPDLSPGERAAIEKGCAETGGLAGGARTGVRLYNLITDEAGTVGLLYHEEGVLLCDVDSTPVPYNAAGGQGDSTDWSWLTGPVTIDGGTLIAGRAGQPGLETRGGRVSAEVARVTVTSDGTTREAELANGTYLVRFLRPSTWSPDRSEPPVLVRAYDSDGDLVDTVRAPVDDGPACYTTPDGTVIHVHSSTDEDRCAPAVAWR